MTSGIEEALEITRAHRRAAALCVIYFFDALIYTSVMLIVSSRGSFFQGWGDARSAELYRYVICGAGLVQFFVIRLLANLPLNNDAEGRREGLKQLLVSAILVYGGCDLVALAGLVLFLLDGARSDFFLMLGLSAVYLLIHFPRERDWKAYAGALSRDA